MTAVVKEAENNGCNQNSPLEPVKCRFDYPLPINDRSTYLRLRDCILGYGWDYPALGYNIQMNSLRNDMLFNSHMREFIKFWLANMDFQLVVDIDKVIPYMTKYVTKQEIETSSGMNKTIKKS